MPSPFAARRRRQWWLEAAAFALFTRGRVGGLLGGRTGRRGGAAPDSVGGRRAPLVPLSVLSVPGGRRAPDGRALRVNAVAHCVTMTRVMHDGSSQRAGCVRACAVCSGPRSHRNLTPHEHPCTYEHARAFRCLPRMAFTSQNMGWPQHYPRIIYQLRRAYVLVVELILHVLSRNGTFKCGKCAMWSTFWLQLPSLYNLIRLCALVLLIVHKTCILYVVINLIFAAVFDSV